MASDPIYLSEHAIRSGLSPQDWDVSIEKYKSPFGRRVVVHVRHRASGKTATDTIVGSRLTKRALELHGQALIKKLVRQLS